jgi:hypothetical protein
MRLTSSDDKMFSIPADPKYMSSLPPNVCEVYGHFKPQGTGSFWVQYDRPTAGGRPEVSGELSIADGGFQFDRFPYPLRRAHGKISLQRDAQSGEDVVRITDLKGHGVTGGPNEKALVEIDGQIGPFHPDLGVQVTVRGHNVSSEPALSAAFPEQTRKALRVFDAPGKGAYPQFKGSFTTTIDRLPERKAQWTIRTDIHLDDARGALVVFPYLMSGVTGDISVLEDHVEIHHAEMKRGDATLALNGRVDWGREPGQTAGVSMRPALNFTARCVSSVIDAMMRCSTPGRSRNAFT